ncbi:T9SS type A sorting domain-containing protein [bacterium]|nr:T9SS type A sorting domain-containing protein [bacterium]MBU1635109.1 T9SS type A sorting domain-containing protein [bacterium]MBU1875075.1 T9SS type A sorting domain-containing protein [bacterium]
MTYTYLLSDVNYAGIEKKHTDKTTTVTIPASQTAIAEDFRLGDVYPNPFNAVFTIPLTLGKSVPVKLTLCDLSGKVIKVISDGVKPAGEYRIAVDCRELSSGIYLIQSTIQESKKTMKVILIK